MSAFAGKTCCKKICHSWRFAAGGKPSRVEQNGKFYCGIHDPVRAAEKRAARNAKWDAEWAAKEAGWRKADALKAATASLVEAVRAATEQRESGDDVATAMDALRKAEAMP